MKSAQGFTLLHVLVLLTILSMVLIAGMRYEKPKHDYASLTLTVSQAQMLLNDVFAYRDYSGHWNMSGGDCVLPQGVALNAFGQPAFCFFPDKASSTNMGNRVGVVQWVPSKLQSLYESSFGSAHVEVYGSFSSPAGYSPPAGFVGVAVYTDTSGGSQQKINTHTFSLAEPPQPQTLIPSQIPRLQCDGAMSSSYFASMSAVCAHVFLTKNLYKKVYSMKGPDHWPCINMGLYPKSDLMTYMRYVGFEFRIDPGITDSSVLNVKYNFYRHQVFSVYNIDLANTLEYQLVYNKHLKCDDPVAKPYLYSQANVKETDDGMSNADFSCDGEAIKTAVFQVCTN